VGWKLKKPGGLVHFQAGPSEGLAVNQKDKDKYAWCREQLINGHRVLAALIRPGAAYDPGLDSERNLPPGNILLLSYPLGGHKGSRSEVSPKLGYVRVGDDTGTTRAQIIFAYEVPGYPRQSKHVRVQDRPLRSGAA
jgi:hypothetical protein